MLELDLLPLERDRRELGCVHFFLIINFHSLPVCLVFAPFELDSGPGVGS